MTPVALAEVRKTRSNLMPSNPLLTPLPRASHEKNGASTSEFGLSFRKMVHVNRQPRRE